MEERREIQIGFFVCCCVPFLSPPSPSLHVDLMPSHSWPAPFYFQSSQPAPAIPPTSLQIDTLSKKAVAAASMAKVLLTERQEGEIWRKIPHPHKIDEDAISILRPAPVRDKISDVAPVFEGECVEVLLASKCDSLLAFSTIRSSFILEFTLLRLTITKKNVDLSKE